MTNQWLALFNLISKRFDLSELNELCFLLNIDPENLWGETANKAHRIIKLIRYVERHQRIFDLLVALKQKRPNEQWPDKESLTHHNVPIDWRIPPLANLLPFFQSWQTLLVSLILIFIVTMWQTSLFVNKQNDVLTSTSTLEAGQVASLSTLAPTNYPVASAPTSQDISVASTIPPTSVVDQIYLEPTTFITPTNLVTKVSTVSTNTRIRPVTETLIPTNENSLKTLTPIVINTTPIPTSVVSTNTPTMTTTGKLTSTPTITPTSEPILMPSPTPVPTSIEIPASTPTNTPDVLQTCEEIRANNPTATDGIYTLYFDRDFNKPFDIYCDNMNEAPTEYLSLFNQTNDGTLINFSHFSVGGATYGEDKTTFFQRIRIDPLTLEITRDDYAHAFSIGDYQVFDGRSVPHHPHNPYARAWSCDREPNGTGNIDLTGTPFAIALGIDFQYTGTAPRGDSTISSNRRSADFTGGGFCGVNHIPTLILEYVGYE